MLEFRETAYWGAAYKTLRQQGNHKVFDGFTSETQHEVARHVWISLQGQTHTKQKFFQLQQAQKDLHMSARLVILRISSYMSIAYS